MYALVFVLLVLFFLYIIVWKITRGNTNDEVGSCVSLSQCLEDLREEGGRMVLSMREKGRDTEKGMIRKNIKDRKRSKVHWSEDLPDHSSYVFCELCTAA